MRLSRLIFWIVVLAGAAWLFTHRQQVLDSVLPKSARTEAPAPAAPSDDALTQAATEADKAQGGGVKENMTPDQVRALLGAPDEIETPASDGGRPRERWIYRQAGKAVVFENGVAVSIEYP
ncbi:MAG TPA: hypothetical protein VFL12_10560 [Thermoanaerobaculia bacterium]|nr:hypothetical protein [Thermoanaerobaculia bacterium]